MEVSEEIRNSGNGDEIGNYKKLGMEKVEVTVLYPNWKTNAFLSLKIK